MTECFIVDIFVISTPNSCLHLFQPNVISYMSTYKYIHYIYIYIYIYVSLHINIYAFILYMLFAIIIYDKGSHILTYIYTCIYIYPTVKIIFEIVI